MGQGVGKDGGRQKGRMREGGCMGRGARHVDPRHVDPRQSSRVQGVRFGAAAAKRHASTHLLLHDINIHRQ